MKFQEKVAIVTGSTQGLGESISRRLIEAGLRGLIICGRNQLNGTRLSEEFNSLGCDTVYVQTDLVSVDDCRELLAVAEDKFPRVDILVNSAGVTDRGSILDTPEDVYDRIFAINTRAPFFLTQFVAKNMIANKTAGSILNIISMSSYGGQPFLAPYSASKGALVTLTKNVAFALMRYHIRVNGLNMGWADTPAEDKIQKEFHGAGDNWLQEAEKNQPFGRLIKPEEVAEVVAFLVSSDSGMMTGAIIDYDQSVHGANYAPPRP
ncbi:SDR family oxidoreductase [bacterium]|nr:SDR family oxidoreductase [bacterium]